jgi:hypothetical protein
MYSFPVVFERSQTHFHMSAPSEQPERSLDVQSDTSFCDLGFSHPTRKVLDVCYAYVGFALHYLLIHASIYAYLLDFIYASVCFNFWHVLFENFFECLLTS